MKHADDVIVNVIDLDTAKSLTAIGSQRRRFRNPAVTPERYLDRFRKNGLVQASHRLQPLAELFRTRVLTSVSDWRWMIRP